MKKNDQHEYEYPTRKVKIIRNIIIFVIVAIVIFWNIYSEKEKLEWSVAHTESLHLFFVAELLFLLSIMFLVFLAGWTFIKAIETIKEGRYPPKNK